MIERALWFGLRVALAHAFMRLAYRRGYSHGYADGATFSLLNMLKGAQQFSKFVADVQEREP